MRYRSIMQICGFLSLKNAIIFKLLESVQKSFNCDYSHVICNLIIIVYSEV